MDASSSTPGVRVGGGRRGRGRVTAAIVILLAWLLGRGLGWIGSSTPSSTADMAASGMQAATATAPVPVAPSAADTPPPASIKASLEPPPPAAPAGETHQPAPSTAMPAPSGDAAIALPPAVDADRFASGVSLIEARTADGQLGSALLALQHLRSLPLDAAQLAALEQPSRLLERALAEACAQLLQSLCKGEVLRSRDDVARLLGDGTVLSPLLTDALRVTGLAGDLLRSLPANDQPAPIPAPLPRHRAVRARWRGQVHAAQVVDSRSDKVTVRIQTAAGQVFPTLDVMACEPVDASLGEALEMGFAALQAHDALTARLWLAAARLRCAGELPPRGKQLAGLVQ